eukprot:8019097-Heterocapsa_arctica.AAC.1
MENVQTAFISWLEEAGVGALRLRTDVEPAVNALEAQLAARSRVKDRTVTIETLPTKSSGSLGSVERYAQT